MNQYRVDKIDAGVTLHLSDGSALRGSVFVSPRSATHSGPQTVVELLTETRATLPFSNAQGTFLLVGMACVSAVSLNDPGHVGEGFWARIPVSLRLEGGHAFRGSLLLEEGAGNRLSDAVRSDDPWLTLEAPSSLVWVSKAHLLTLEPERG